MYLLKSFDRPCFNCSFILCQVLFIVMNIMNIFFHIDRRFLMYLMYFNVVFTFISVIAYCATCQMPVVGGH